MAEHADMPLLEQAAIWFDRLSAGELGDSERQLFESWRQDNPAHATAFAEIEAAHATAKALSDSNELLALRQETLSRLVVLRSSRRNLGLLAASLAMLLVAGAAFLTLSPWSTPSGPAQQVAQRQPGSYETAIGERLTTTLPDGSRVTLNTGSRVRVAYSDRERLLVLERGQALFEVAHGQPRPFVVIARGQRITATGTTFDVRIDREGEVKVALIEGRVIVRADRPGGRSTTLQPREVLVVAPTAVTVTSQPEIDRLVSWRNGMLIFEDDRLSEAVAEMNRYVSRPIILQDDRVRGLRISGAFRTGETDTFIEALEMSFPVRVVERRSDAIVLASRS